MIKLPHLSRLAGVGLLALLAGCASTPATIPPPPATGDASWRAVEAADTVHYELAMGEVSSGATPATRVAPVYPASLLGACPPPQEVTARLIVDGEGKVDEVRVADEFRANADRRLFIEAVRTAALQWDFLPLTISRWAADADGESHVVDQAVKPFSLDYVFRFECHAGEAAVSTTAADS